MYFTVVLLCRFLPFPQLCPERAFKANNYICTTHPPSIVYSACSKFNKPLKKNEHSSSVASGCKEDGGFWFVFVGFFFFPRVELIHSSTLPMQIYCYLYSGTGKKVCGIMHLHCSSPKSPVIDQAMPLYANRSRAASPPSELII